MISLKGNTLSCCINNYRKNTIANLLYLKVYYVINYSRDIIVMCVFDTIKYVEKRKKEKNGINISEL